MRLHDLGAARGTDKAWKHHYLDRYQPLLPVDPATVVELGVLDGASLLMWADYYPDAQVHGFDIVPCEIDHSRVTVHVQDAYTFAAAEQVSQIGLLVDDGPHTLDSMLHVASVWSAHAGTVVIEDIPDPAWVPQITAAFPSYFRCELVDCRDVGRFDSLAVVACTS